MYIHIGSKSYYSQVLESTERCSPFDPTPMRDVHSYQSYSSLILHAGRPACTIAAANLQHGSVSRVVLHAAGLRDTLSLEQLVVDMDTSREAVPEKVCHGDCCTFCQQHVFCTVACSAMCQDQIVLTHVT